MQTIRYNSKKVKHQKASSNSTNLNKDLHKCMEKTGAFNEETADNLISISYWIREHCTQSTKSNKAICNQCNKKLCISH